MAIELRQQLKLSQQLVMTPQLQQAIRLLQLSRLELVDLVRDEMLENPCLDDDVEMSGDRKELPLEVGGEEDFSRHTEQAGTTDLPLSDMPVKEGMQEVKPDAPANTELDWENYLDNYSSAGPTATSFRADSDDLPSLEATLTKQETLGEHLAWQLKMSDLDDRQKQIGAAILGNLDNDGYFKDPPVEELAAELECEPDEIEIVLEKIQSFEPVGVAARSLEECMLIQAMANGKDEDLIIKIIKSHMVNLEKRNYPAIARDLKASIEQVYSAVKIIMEFDPRPGRQFANDDAHYITPDVYVHKVGDKYFVVSNDDGLPRLKIASYYRNALDNRGGAKDYIQEKLRSAQWLIRSIQQRQRTIIRVTESIVKFQRDFLDRGVSHLKPLILRDVAEDIGMHESTISRVTTSKYVHTQQGIYELKFFFSSGISRTNGDDLASQAVKSKIKEFIDKEDPKRPLSDQRLVEMLKEANIDIARRTVAKYREQLGVLSSSKRKQMF